jgi:type IV pilus assembly protein PilV
MPTRPLRPSSRRPPAGRGVALIEALVGGLVFAIGVLGVVALQASMTQAQTVGQHRADAIYLADELIGLLWSDMPNRASYVSAACSGYTRCTDWAAKVARLLPGGTSAVAVDTTTGVVTVTVTWTTRTGSQSYATSTAVTP